MVLGQLAIHMEKYKIKIPISHHKKKTDGLNTRRDISKTGEHKGINIYIYIWLYKNENIWYGKRSNKWINQLWIWENLVTEDDKELISTVYKNYYKMRR